ncbi:MAG: hypothetical protein ABJB12_21395 [Pseudomonadota bacterium]
MRNFPTRARRGFSACGVAWCALLVGPRAHADALGPTLLQYQAPADCPGAADFQRSVQRRSARIQFVAEGSHDRALTITIQASGPATVGELRLVESNGSARQRSVRFSSCSEAVEGLALIATVSLDPQMLFEAPATEPPAPPPAASAGTSPPAAHVEAPRASTRIKNSATVKASLGAQAEAYLHAVPESAVGGGLYFDLTFQPEARVSTLLRAALSHAERRGISEGSGEASFALTVATLSVCPWRLGGALLELRPCAWAGAGALRAWSRQTTKPQAHTSQYWAGGGSALAFVRLGKFSEIALDVGVGVPALRDTFVFEGRQFWKTPAVYLSAGLGLRVSLH